ncbi:Calcium/calcium/calmodulin-dependent Serine/Threonine-kinase [Heracleum sosnowskyi]|uniref:Calcium/calcium/calmodulin-dependent Serine/Threonine-kinase n=1 Tax=Heracleum sosnowskyi TaxID=360622 RepID=A0AAD8MYA5_9APIA|nr:Calcium/calcium/calmodulin-dependent Serine/Threonine-kinase [Heracleum sosnowskyi]
MGVYFEKFIAYLYAIVMLMCSVSRVKGGHMTAIGDPGMTRDGLRVAIEAWNQCNEVGEEAPDMGSPRQADCFDLMPPDSTPTSSLDSLPFKLIHRVNQTDNMYGIANAQNQGLKDIDVDKYAAWKEVYLGTKCEVSDEPRPWQFWMIMLKSGNMDTLAAICPENGKKAQPFPQDSRFPCFGKGCMNMPMIYHDYTSVQGITSMKGRFYGTWDLNANITAAKTANDTSYYSVTWEKKIGKTESWVFHHFLKTSTKYPWLMLYLRSDAINGFSGGYHYQTRGMTKIVPKSPHFKVRFTLDIKQGGGPRSQFYLMDIGSCWKNNGQPCDGNVTTDVTRYSEMIINPSTEAWCKPDDLGKCPPYHTLSNGTKIHRSDTRNFPYAAYHYYCSPGNAQHIEKPFNYCDAYSNPQPQEILQILPHPAWGEYGYPIHKGQGWVNDSRTWELDVGRLSQSLYFYQDPGTAPFERHWPSIDLGTEIYISENQVAEWTVSDFDIIVPDTQSADA